MRLAALLLLVLGLSASVATGAANAPSGTLSIVDGRGTVQIIGKGVLVGLVDKGSLEIVDLSSDDQWSPRVNGVPRGRRAWIRGEQIRVFVPAGRYRVVARGTGIQISAQGSGAVVLQGNPDRVGATGLYAVGGPTCKGTDKAGCSPLPAEATNVLFGKGDASAPSSQ